MPNRIRINETEPDAYQALLELEKYLNASTLEKKHKHLIKIRASQINGCAYCIDMHTKESLRAGEMQHRIFLLSAWQETDVFNEKEKAILKITEEITLIHQEGLTEKTYRNALIHFDENYLAQIIMAVISINSWNRIGISTKLPIPK